MVEQPAWRSVPVRRRGMTVPAAVALLVSGWLLGAVPAAAHVQAGAFGFAVGAGSGPVTSPTPPQLPTPWQVAGRWLETAGVLLLVGVVTVAQTVWRRPGPIGPDEPRYRPLGVLAAVVGAVGLAWQVAAGAATGGGLGPGAVAAFVNASRPGYAPGRAARRRLGSARQARLCRRPAAAHHPARTRPARP